MKTTLLTSACILASAPLAANPALNEVNKSATAIEIVQSEPVLNLTASTANNIEPKLFKVALNKYENISANVSLNGAYKIHYTSTW